MIFPIFHKISQHFNCFEKKKSSILAREKRFIVKDPDTDEPYKILTSKILK